MHMQLLKSNDHGKIVIVPDTGEKPTMVKESVLSERLNKPECVALRAQYYAWLRSGATRPMSTLVSSDTFRVLAQGDKTQAQFVGGRWVYGS